jgi:hypothetical protein
MESYGYQSNKRKHAFRNEAIAEIVHGCDKVIAISLKQVDVDFKVGVTHLKHLHHVVTETLILDGVHLLDVVDSVNLRLTRF